MVAYLALHRDEPVTGERLRTRVLTHADVDASQRTLANTASAVRRSLGVDAAGPRLHPVTSSGLYVTHGVSSDVETLRHPRRPRAGVARRRRGATRPPGAAAHQGRAPRKHAARLRVVPRRGPRGATRARRRVGRARAAPHLAATSQLRTRVLGRPAGTADRPLQRRARRGADARAAPTRVWRRWSRPRAARCPSAPAAL